MSKKLNFAPSHTPHNDSRYKVNERNITYLFFSLFLKLIRLIYRTKNLAFRYCEILPKKSESKIRFKFGKKVEKL
jgi:hypothetical protein